MTPAHPPDPAADWSRRFGADLPPECREGVAQALAALAEHRRIVAAALADGPPA